MLAVYACIVQGQLNNQEGYFPKNFVVMLSKSGKVGIFLIELFFIYFVFILYLFEMQEIGIFCICVSC